MTTRARLLRTVPCATHVVRAQHGLVLMGTHGVLGGVAYRVMRAAHRPVLAIRQPDRPWLL